MLDPTFIPMSAIALPMIIVPTVLVMRHVGRKREYEHVERMKALELGRAVPGNEAWPAKVCIAIGAGVPLGSFFLAWIAGQGGGSGEERWVAASLVGMAGVVGGTILATRLLGSRNPSRGAEVDHRADAKAPFDPDAFDVVGRRG